MAAPWLWAPPANDLPLPVVSAFFLICWMESFPMTAMTSFLSDEIGMSLSTITIYYTLIYLPFMWKPFYGWVSDRFPIAGFHRTPYIMCSAIGCAADYLTIAFWVKSTWELFAVAMFLSFCTAFLQLMVEGFLVDVARKDVRNSVALQAVANAAKSLGTLTSQLMALALYAHGGDGDSKSVIKARPAIAMTSVAPIVIAVMSPFLPEARAPNTSGCCRQQCACSREAQLLGVAAVVVQLNIMLFGLRGLMPAEVWRPCVVGVLPTSALLLAALFGVGRCVGRRRAQPEALLDPPEEPQQSTCWWIRLCLFCFAVNSLPKSTVVITQFQYVSFTPESYQALTIISCAASVMASCAIGRTFQGWGAVRLIAVTTLVAALSQLTLWPFAALAIREVGVRHGLLSTVGALGLGSTFLCSLASLFTVLPMDALITAASGSVAVDRTCTAYSVFLSCYSFGGTVSGLIAAPLVDALGLNKEHWSALPVWVVSVALVRLLALALLPLVPGGRISEPGGSSEREIPLVEQDRECSPDGFEY